MGCSQKSAINERERASSYNRKLKSLTNLYKKSIKRNPTEVQEYLKDNKNYNVEKYSSGNEIEENKKSELINIQFRVIINMSNPLIKVFDADINPYKRFSITLAKMLSKYINDYPSLKSIDMEECSFKDIKINPEHTFIENGIKSGDLINVSCRSTNADDDYYTTGNWTMENKNSEDFYLKCFSKKPVIKSKSNCVLNNKINYSERFNRIYNEFAEDNLSISDFDNSKLNETEMELEFDS